MWSLLRKTIDRGREEARQPGSWIVFAFIGALNVGQAIYADSVLGRLIFLVVAGLAILVAVKFFLASRTAPQDRTD
ncbi:hypothetical protein [Nocardioides sp. AX2bis]|uniref:hypothetical protein n=1 Tax=Nocardioides sp. AX2bis TaxID=2653157 RepID=UPI0012F2FEF0|nr:hypothetical protein [Nocardioides sp. AX2bis]VXC43006.1 hypothetical protein NOCARDAX2BIS_540011 [Nocardioides sp. AX2bis]